jgi:hypothetical protein
MHINSLDLHVDCTQLRLVFFCGDLSTFRVSPGPLI